ncbi:MAG: hypothetical protein ACK42H_23710 [Planctomycetota bacterium]
MSPNRHGSPVGPLDAENRRFSWDFLEWFESNIAHFEGKASVGQKTTDRDKPRDFLGFFRLS